MAILVYAMLCVVPALVFELVARGLNRWTTHETPNREQCRRRRRDRSGKSVARPLAAQFVRPNCDRYCADLRRLSDTYARLQTAELPARALRLRAVEMAYDDILRDACVAFELDRPPEHLDAITRLQVEADLLTAGLRW